jgi:hypothetical protein
MGFMRVQMPPGLRKSGMPDSVEMPAPVSATTVAAVSIKRRKAAASSNAGAVRAICSTRKKGDLHEISAYDGKGD